MARTRRSRAAIIAAAAVLLAVLVVTVAAERAGASQLFVVATDGQAATTLARSHARVIARYEAFTLVEAAGNDAERLAERGAARRDDMRAVRLGRRVLDPTRDRRALPAAREGPAGPSLALVQFVGPIKDEWRHRLVKTGVRIVSYMAQNGYLVHGTLDELARVSELTGRDPAVRAVVPFTAEDKLGADIHASGRQRLAVQTLTGEDGASARRAVDVAGRELRDTTAVGPFRTQFVEVDAAQAAQIASEPGVVSVQSDPDPELHDEVQDQLVADDLVGTDPVVPAGPGYFAFHEALGLGTATFPFSVDLTDAGIDAGVVGTTHPDLHVDGDRAAASRLDYVDNFTTDDDATDCGGHGTLNAGIVGGFNTAAGSTGPAAVEDAAGYNYGLGVAPRVRLGGSKIFKCVGGTFSLTSTLTALTSSAYAKGARISNNSWGADTGGAYNANAQEYDKLVRDAVPGTAGNQEMVEVFSAGNAGSDANTVGAPGIAKNVITVGATENVRATGIAGCGTAGAGADDAHDVIAFSSRGPTDDGRIKPDLVAPGTNITGPRPQHARYAGRTGCSETFPPGSALYRLSSGTSQAAPAVSGMAALVREWYRQRKGAGTAVPSPALTKAILANSASDLAGGANGAGATNTNVPDQVQGWGLPSLRRALDAGPRFLRDQQDVFGETGDAASRVFTVQDPNQPVRVTLAFTDAFGPTVGDSFVNDLDLNVGSGTDTFKGNVFSAGRSVTGGTSDPRDNLESVYLPSGTSGRFSVGVTAANVAGDGVPGNADPTDQDFALVVSNAAEVAAPVLDGVSGAVTPRGDGDAQLEPGEDYTVSGRVRNSGTTPATGVAGSLTGGASTGITDSTAAWPDLAPSMAAVNGDPLAGALRADAQCGAPVPLTLAITSTEGASTTIPISVPTGAAGPPASLSSSDGPRAIPDNDPAGVSSTLTVEQAGIIKDVDVRIPRLTHSFVGDLKLELTAPGATTIVLADRPGGTLNNGDDLTDTVFDDEAPTAIGAGGTAAPYTGSFRPQADQLARLDSGPQQGVWTLRVTDRARSDSGTLSAWGHDISSAACDFRPATGPGPGAGNEKGNGPATALIPVMPLRPMLDLSTVPRTIGADTRGFFRFPFRATPGAAGSVTIRTAKPIAAAGRKRRRLTLARASFTVPASGRVKLKLRLSAGERRLLRRSKRLRVTATVKLGGATASRALTLRTPRRNRH